MSIYLGNDKRYGHSHIKNEWELMYDLPSGARLRGHTPLFDVE